MDFKQRKLMIAPSLLSADFARMAEEIASVEADGADMLHCDVMDGVFVPNITFGHKMIADIAKVSSLPLDVHLMIVNPAKHIESFIDAGASTICFHIEATDSPIDILKKIRKRGVRSGIVLSPDTPVIHIQPTLDYCDQVLLMSVYPGFSGQQFLPQSYARLEELRALIGDRDIDIEVDGGVNLQNVSAIKAAGANILVAGNTVFCAESPRMAIEALKYL